MKFPVIPVSSAIIIKNGKILIGLRSKKDQGGGLWEFPGGKIELEESDVNAIIRELKEELGINAIVEQKVMQYVHKYKNTLYDISFFEINSFNGEVKMNVHDEIKWIDLSNLKDYVFISGDLLFIDKLLNNPSILNGLNK
ncbi:MAG: (deoxy)nucleoside triphosphate pyrophosphohydrolase [Candidatus Neomarinimicrobiota bacterium]